MEYFYTNSILFIVFDLLNDTLGFKNTNISLCFGFLTSTHSFTLSFYISIALTPLRSSFVNIIVGKICFCVLSKLSESIRNCNHRWNHIFLDINLTTVNKMIVNSMRGLNFSSDQIFVTEPSLLANPIIHRWSHYILRLYTSFSSILK